MQIVYQEINGTLLEKMVACYGDWVTKYIHFEDGSFSLAALHDDVPLGFISTYTRTLPNPLCNVKDAYIDVIEVDKQHRRRGIASELINRAEQWASENNFLQVRAWSSRDKAEAIPMWVKLQYGMCPAKIWNEQRRESVDGYYVVKRLRPSKSGC